ncbi:MAG TPA: VOC family protein [Candidatus Acidoferrales bacterium]|nr:VOC family protein [Candidatus Acidoferrales bacterium]
MAEPDRYRQLDEAIEALLGRPPRGRARRHPRLDARLAALGRVAGELRGLPRSEFKARLKEELMQAAANRSPKPAAGEQAGLGTVTPYIVAIQALELAEFYQRAFGAKVDVRGKGSAGGYHIEIRLGGSLLMLGGSGEFRGPEMPTALWYFVEDADAVYRRALELGAMPISAPADQPYGDREASIKDPSGNNWYISTHRGASYIREGLTAVTPYLHPASGAAMIRFLERAFGAEVVERHDDPDGAVRHAVVRIGDSAIAMGEARGQYQPMPTMFYLNVDDVDAWYRRAIEAGATPMHPPAAQAHGARVGAAKDPFDNQWWISTPVASS